MSQEAAQKALDLYTAKAETLLKGQAEANAKQWADVRAGWRSEIGKDPDLKGDGISYAQRAAREVGGDRFIKEVCDTGFGDHPSLLKVLATLGRLLSEDTLVNGWAKRLLAVHS